MHVAVVKVFDKICSQFFSMAELKIATFQNCRCIADRDTAIPPRYRNDISHSDVFTMLRSRVARVLQLFMWRPSVTRGSRIALKNSSHAIRDTHRRSMRSFRICIQIRRAPASIDFPIAEYYRVRYFNPSCSIKSSVMRTWKHMLLCGIHYMHVPRVYIFRTIVD